MTNQIIKLQDLPVGQIVKVEKHNRTNYYMKVCTTHARIGFNELVSLNGKFKGVVDYMLDDVKYSPVDLKCKEEEDKS